MTEITKIMEGYNKTDDPNKKENGQHDNQSGSKRQDESGAKGGEQELKQEQNTDEDEFYVEDDEEIVGVIRGDADEEM